MEIVEIVSNHDAALDGVDILAGERLTDLLPGVLEADGKEPASGVEDPETKGLRAPSEILSPLAETLTTVGSTLRRPTPPCSNARR
jgi:hypothetical protein